MVPLMMRMKWKVKRFTPNSALLHNQMVYHCSMLFLTISLITLISSVALHKLVLMKAVNECPFQVGGMTLKQAKAERDFARMTAGLYI